MQAFVYFEICTDSPCSSIYVENQGSQRIDHVERSFSVVEPPILAMYDFNSIAKKRRMGK